MASAPDTQIRIEVRSASAAPASSISRYIAGTPTNREGRRSSMARSTMSALKRGRNQTGSPADASPSRAAKPMMCATGRLTTTSLSRSRPGQSAPPRS
jgi:hypothetical protein